MSAELISMKEWEQAKIIDWSVRYCLPLLMQFTEAEQKRILERLEREFAASGLKR
jgi:hypothetical protein